jgi:CHAT domain-containing protein/Tfp pilus assembly protein PilF
MPRITRDSLFRHWMTALLAFVLASHLVALQASGARHITEWQATASQRDVRKLEVGRLIERELTGGQSHSYQIELASGQYLNVVVFQRGIDVAVTVIGPDAKPLMEVDSPNGALGPEPVGLIAGTPGTYRLDVHSLDEGAPKGRYDIRVLELRSATENDRQLLQARKLATQSVQSKDEGKHDEAVKLARSALTIAEKIYGVDAPETADFLYNLADTYFGKRDYKNSELFHRRALAIREKTLEPDHPDLAPSLDGLARLYDDTGDYAKAAPLYQRALAIREKALGPEHPDVATYINNLAGLYYKMGNYARAEPLYQRALAIWEKSLGSNHPYVAAALTGLAELYRKRGDYTKGEPLFQRAVAIFEKANDPNLAKSLNGLAVLYYMKGDYAKAEPLYQRALKLSEQTVGPDNPDLAQPVKNLADLYYTRGDYSKAGPLYQRALAISEKAFGPNHPDVGHSLNNLAWLYKANGEYAKAEPLFQRALAIAEKALGPNHPDVAASLNNLAVLYYVKEDYAKAEPLYQRALAISEKELGADHPYVATLLNNLAQLCEAKGDIQRAVALKSRSNDIFERNIAMNLATGSERQKLLYLETLSGQTNSTISLHVHSAPGNAAARRLALTAILRRKGRALDAMADSISTLRRRLLPQDQMLLDRLNEARAQMADLALKAPGQSDLAKYQSETRLLREEMDRLESEISARSSEFSAQAKPVTIESVQAAIPGDAVLVEFVSFRPFNPKYKTRDEQFGEARYVAYTLGHRGEPKWIELGAAKEIDDAVDSLRKELRSPDRPNQDARRVARAVDSKVFAPIRRLIGKTRKVLLSTDGSLNLIPFEALVDEKDRYLIERYSFTYLTSGRDLLRLQSKGPSKQGVMIIANPDFGATGPVDSKRGLKIAASATNPATGRLDFSQFYFPPLPGTNEEARALQGILPAATLLLREQATKAAIKQVAAPRILHIATHGFFLADTATLPSTGDRGLFLSGVSSDAKAARLDNALLRSGLAMAGANLHDENDDGILTALEVAGLNLWGTRLVVLSACETALGEVRNGDGVYGLRRALLLAGSETQVMSLWKIDDQATRDLMTDYYNGLQAGRGRGDALRQAQRRMLASKNRQHPYYWASFIQSGEWANLDGKR